MYLILFIATLCLLGIYIKDTTYVNYLHHCIDDLEKANKNLRESNEKLKALAFEKFQNVKDEIERLANEKELNTICGKDND